MLTVKNLQITEKKIKPTKELDKFVDLIRKYNLANTQNANTQATNTQNAYNMLPQNSWDVVSFELKNTTSAFANGIRRVFVEELDVQALHVNFEDIFTDDAFINGIDDMLVNNLGLIPIYQDIDLIDKYDIYLSVFNNTNKMMQVKVSNISVILKGKSKPSSTDNYYSSSNLELNSKIFPESNIVIADLNPGKFLKLRNINIKTGKGFQNAGNFTLLNGVNYKPLDIVPYDQFTSKGTRSITHNCSEFYLEFTTKGTISGKTVMKKVTDYLTELLNNIKEKVTSYKNEEKKSALYSGPDCTVEVTNSVTSFKFMNLYLTGVSMIAMKCFQLDETIPLCTFGVERYDTQVACLKIKHANSVDLILKSIDSLKEDLLKIRSQFE